MFFPASPLALNQWTAVAVAILPDGTLDAFVDGARSSRVPGSGAGVVAQQRARQRLLWVPSVRPLPSIAHAETRDSLSYVCVQ